jgi:ribosomal protein S18 acetylase RimI-like enzyme
VLLTVRPARHEDVPLLAELYDRTYRGGYSASFDHYGSIKPGDFWWVQTEKELLLLEVNHRTAGLVIVGRRDEALVVEEVIVDEAAARGRDGDAGKSEQVFIQRLGAYLLQHFRRARQERVLLRTTESNAWGLTLARSLDLGFTNLLIVAAFRPRSRHAVKVPEGYVLRKAGATDVPELTRIYRECFAAGPAPAELDALLRRPGVRAWVAERDRYPVGFLLAEAHARGFGDLVVAVREAHRRRGLGRALATPAMNFFHGKQIPALGLYWGLDGSAQAYYRALGFETERVYLFFEKSI